MITQYINLIKCDHLGHNLDNKSLNEQVFDGYIELESDSVKNIKSALSKIDTTIKGLSLFFTAPLIWRTKYQYGDHDGGSLTPSEEEIKHFIENIHKKIINIDIEQIKIAIDWFTRGLTASDSNVSFFSYWSAIDGLSQSLSKGSFKELGYEAWGKSDEELELEAREKLDAFYNRKEGKKFLNFIRKDLIEFAYLVRRKTMYGIEQVFGVKSKEFNEMFERKYNEYTLWDFRNHVAHGLERRLPFIDNFTPSYFASVMGTICRNFILRILLGLKPEDKISQGTNKFIKGFSGFDPRSCQCFKNSGFFPSDDWRIRLEWIDPQLVLH